MNNLHKIRALELDEYDTAILWWVKVHASRYEEYQSMRFRINNGRLEHWDTYLYEDNKWSQSKLRWNDTVLNRWIDEGKYPLSKLRQYIE